MLYLMVIGERIDALSVSNLLCGWREIGLYSGLDDDNGSEEAIDLVKRMVLAKQDQGAFFSKGCGNALVNIIKACNEMQISDDKFIECMLSGL